MIYLTGDIHGDLEVTRLSHRNWPQGRCLAQDEDYVIILGDFGLVWSLDPDDKSEKYWLDWLENCPWTTLFIDGNHENFARLDSDEFPVGQWNGGLAQFIRPHVIHLMRGEIYGIDGMRFLAYGGANSSDRSFRTENIDWWAREVPDDADRQRCMANLAACANEVDVVLTHEAPAWAYYTTLAGKIDYAPDNVSNWLQSNISDTAQFKRWYFGHHHIDCPYDRPYTALYQEIVELDLNEDTRGADGIATDDYAAIWN